MRPCCKSRRPQISSSASATNWSARSRAREAARMPWKDLTAATLAELRFNSITNWLPASEAETLRVSFNQEMARLWDVAAREAEEAPQK
jgi:hypothetical protein